MKHLTFILLLLSFVIFTGCTDKTKNELTGGLKGTITISGAWALYPMAVKWAEEFKKINPRLRIEVSAGGAGKGMADVLSDVVDIGNVSREIFPQEIEKGAWWISVVKDAVVPTCHINNPSIDAIKTKGLRKEDFQALWMKQTLLSWDMMTDTQVSHQITIYTRSDACGAAQTWATFLGGNQEDLNGVGVYGDPGLAEAVRKDIYGVGFNNINYVYDSKTGYPVSGLAIIPMDLNSNGTIDPPEDFYKTRDDIIEAISTSVYPSPPARLLHFVCHGKPKKKIVRDFLLWVLTEGQSFIKETGYIPVQESEIERGLRELND
ncbi:MAG: PstS family phosphate ABC transporter substrate-binding protein [Spirochaetales bacterium]|nr:PstS family phosphate ABC transporter substrate-binding protein [Spirochaetales bacterium]